MIMIKRFSVFGTLFLSISLFINVLANDDKQEALKIKRLTSQVEFDGRPFEEAWNGLGFFSNDGKPAKFWFGTL